MRTGARKPPRGLPEAPKCGTIGTVSALSTVALENTMSEINKFTLPAALILALSLSACSSQPVKEEAAPAPAPAAAEPAAPAAT
jgi:hypothetical protein